MSVTIVKLGSARARGEGLRIGTVRRPPRGVPKRQWAELDYFDVWYPLLAPSEKLLRSTRAALRGRPQRKDWNTFVRRYTAEMKQPGPSRTLDLLAALSHEANFSVGCYCEDEQWCHRGVLRQLLEERQASIG
jgi:uncharacterized protein YeaO (DUF488 family)